MVASLDIWAHGFSSGEPGYGGWSYVIADNGVLSGAAGGARSVTTHDMLLTGILEALGAADAARPVSVHSNVLPREAASSPALWARLGAVRAGPITYRRADHPFLKAWADEGQKHAKTRGSFHAAIPKLNLKAFKAKP